MTSQLSKPETERCPSCGSCDEEYKKNAYARCNDPWHADDHLRRRHAQSTRNDIDLRDMLQECRNWLYYAYHNVDSVTSGKVKAALPNIDKQIAALAVPPQERPQNPNGTPRATIAVWLNEHPGEDVFTAGEAIWAALQADGHVPNHSQEATTQPVEPRFFIDHGMIHDRVTGKHVVTNGTPPFEDSIEQVLDLLNSLTVRKVDVRAKR